MPLSIYQSTSTISLYYHFLPLLSLIYYLTVSPYNPSLLTLYHCYIPLLSLNRSIFTTSFSNCSTINVSLYYPSINQHHYITKSLLYHKITLLSLDHSTITSLLFNPYITSPPIYHSTITISIYPSTIIHSSIISLL